MLTGYIYALVSRTKVYPCEKVQERRLSYVDCVSSMLVKKNYQVTCGVAIDFTSNNDHSFY